MILVKSYINISRQQWRLFSWLSQRSQGAAMAKRKPHLESKVATSTNERRIKQCSNLFLYYKFYRSFISLKRNEMKEIKYEEAAVEVRAPPLGADGREGERLQRGTARRRVRHLDEPQGSRSRSEGGRGIKKPAERPLRKRTNRRNARRNNRRISKARSN